MLFLSCTNDGLQSVKKPSDLVSRETMANIMADMHMADAGLSANNLTPDSIKRMNAGYYDFVLNKYQTSQESFEASFDYYLSIPMEMDTIYTFIVDELNKRETQSRGASVPIPAGESMPVPSSKP